MTCIKRPIFIESDKICISLEPIIFVLHSSWPAVNNVRNPENLFSGIIYGTFVALCSVCVYFPPVSFDGIVSRKQTSLFLFLSSRRKSNSFFALIKNHFLFFAHYLHDQKNIFFLLMKFNFIIYSSCVSMKKNAKQSFTFEDLKMLYYMLQWCYRLL